MYARLVQKSRLGKLASNVANNRRCFCAAECHLGIVPWFKVYLNKKSIVDSIQRRCVTSISPDESKYPTLVDMKRFLRCHGIDFKHQFACLQLDCPICRLKRKGNEIIGMCFINARTGSFLCHSCKSSGSWDLFQEIIFKLEKDGTIEDVPSNYGPTKANSIHYEGILRKAHKVEQLSAEKLLCLQKNLDLSLLKQSTMARFSIHTNEELNVLLTPVYHVDGTLWGIHYLNNLKEQILEPKSCWYPIGWKFEKEKQELVLTSSLPDFLALKQEVNCSCMLLPHGTQWLPLEILPLLENVKKIILWLGGDINSWEAAKTFARKLNVIRCYYIRPSKSDNLRPIDALRAGMNLKKLLNEASPVDHKSITTFESLREEVKSELIAFEQVSGVQWKRFSAFNKLLKGHRRGELTVFTGPTGSGKTTFISDYSLDLCIQGVSTLWGSFELHHIRLAKLMLQQFSCINLEENIDKYDTFADKFEKLPLYFMTFQGQNRIKTVLEAMNHAVYVYDIAHVIVDNLQFMMGTPEESKATIDRFYRQDLIIAAFRKFASINNCHVTLVVHPRKEKDPSDLNVSSIFGGAKATQEADNVMILQDKRLTTLRGKKFIQVAKNRFSGDLGLVPIEFNKECKSFSYKTKK